MLPSYDLSKMKEVSEHVRQNLTTENDVTWTLTKLYKISGYHCNDTAI